MLEQFKVGNRQAVSHTDKTNLTGSSKSLSISSSSTTTSTSEPLPVYNNDRIVEPSTSASNIPSPASTYNDYADASEHLQQPEPDLNKLHHLHVQESQSSPSKLTRPPSKPEPIPQPPSKPAPIPPPHSKPAPLPASLSKQASIPRPPSESAPIPPIPTKSAPPPLQTYGRDKGEVKERTGYNDQVILDLQTYGRDKGEVKERAGYNDQVSLECKLIFNIDLGESPDTESICGNLDMNSATAEKIKTAPSDSTSDDRSEDETPEIVYLYMDDESDDESTNAYEKLNELSNNASGPQTSPQTTQKSKEHKNGECAHTNIKYFLLNKVFALEHLNILYSYVQSTNTLF